MLRQQMMLLGRRGVTLRGDLGSMKLNPIPMMPLRNQVRTVSTTMTSRIMLPDDSNPAGNVHGGVILKMLEEVGIITAHRHLFSNKEVREKNKDLPRASVALARVDRVDFENPMHIGQLAQLESRVTFAGHKSIEVQVNVFAEDIHTGQRKQTNKARLWYVVVDDFVELPGWQNNAHVKIPPKLAVSKYEIPPLKFHSQEEEVDAVARYQAQKQSRNPDGSKLEALSSIRRPGYQPVLSHVAHPNDCYRSGSIFGGVIMKLMDTAAGVTAVRYCQTNCVTASVEALNMLAPVFLGNIIRVFAHPTFTSARTLEVAVYVEAMDVFSGHSWQAVSAHLTFVSLDKKGKTLPIPPLVPKSHEARVDYKLGEERYRLRKLERSKAS